MHKIRLSALALLFALPAIAGVRIETLTDGWTFRLDGEEDLMRRRNECRTNMVVGAQMSGYDLWGPHPNDYPPDIEFEHQERNPQIYGEFVWTGFDYLGEPDPCAKSGGRSSYFGIFDLAGLPKDRYWLYKSLWRPNEPVAHILPHVPWPSCRRRRGCARGPEILN